jgi:RNA polymerase sigma factor (sigma-70 family)
MEPESPPGRVPGMDLALHGPAFGVDARRPATGHPPAAGTTRDTATATAAAVATAAATAAAETGAAEPAGAPATARQGDESFDLPGAQVRSFDAFYAAHRTAIGRAVALAIGDVDLAGDATDEAMARAYERWAMVSRLERPEGWVYRVAVNWSVSVLRRRRRSLHRLYQPPAGDDAQIPDPAVHDALGALDVKHRSVVICRHLLGWTVAETADALGVQEGTVKSRLHRAHRLLQSRLAHLRDREEGQ